MRQAALERMRLCFAVTAEWEGWDEQTRAEAAAEIRAAFDADDEEMLQLWAAWLEDMSGLDRMAALCRAAEARILEASPRRRKAA